jgi:ubiquitin
MERVERIKELLAQKAAIDGELAQLKQQVKQEKAAFTAMRKPRKQRENSNE